MPSPRRWSGLHSVLIASVMLSTLAAAQSGRTVTGTYNTTIAGPQGPVKAVIVLKREAGAFAGTLAAEGFPAIPVINVVPSDSGVSLQGDSPDGPVAVKLKFAAADKVTGTLVYQGQEMTLEGSYVAEGASSASALQAAGTYELKSTEPLMGMPEFSVTCSLTRAADRSYNGMCGNDQGSAPINTVAVDGNVVTMSGDSPAGPFKAIFAITGLAAAGTLQLGAETAKMKGTFAPK